MSAARGKADRAGVYLRTLSCDLLNNDNIRTSLTRLVDDFTDVEGALYFACLLHLVQETEKAAWWWRFASGAGNVTAAYCLYLLHLSRSELQDADHWVSQVLATDNPIDCLPLTWTRHPPTSRFFANLRQAFKSLEVFRVAGMDIYRPTHPFLSRIWSDLGPGTRRSATFSPAPSGFGTRDPARSGSLDFRRPWWT